MSWNTATAPIILPLDIMGVRLEINNLPSKINLPEACRPVFKTSINSVSVFKTDNGLPLTRSLDIPNILSAAELMRTSTPSSFTEMSP